MRVLTRGFSHDLPRRERASLARECHLPDVPHGLQAAVDPFSGVSLVYSLLPTADHLPIYSQIAFVKMYATKTAQETAADAVQIFGGRGISRGGMGKHIEHYHRTVPFDSVLGGGASSSFHSIQNLS